MTGLAEFILHFILFTVNFSRSLWGKKKGRTVVNYCVLNMHGNANIIGRSMGWCGTEDRIYYVLLTIQWNGIVCQDSLVSTGRLLHVPVGYFLPPVTISTNGGIESCSLSKN